MGKHGSFFRPANQPMECFASLDSTSSIFYLADLFTNPYISVLVCSGLSQRLLCSPPELILLNLSLSISSELISFPLSSPFFTSFCPHAFFLVCVRMCICLLFFLSFQGSFSQGKAAISCFTFFN